MSGLKLGPLLDDTPVRITIELPASVHRDLVAYGELLARETGRVVQPAKLIGPMVARFMATDRGFAKTRKTLNPVESDYGGSSAPPTYDRARPSTPEHASSAAPSETD